jgi:hypothetical protein
MHQAGRLPRGDSDLEDAVVSLGLGPRASAIRFGSRSADCSLSILVLGEPCAVGTSGQTLLIP